MSRADTQAITRLEGETTLQPDHVMTLARETAEGLKRGGLKFEDDGLTDDGSLRLKLKSTGLGYAVRGINAAGGQGNVIVFVGAGSDEIPSGRRDVLVQLDSLYTSQQTVGGFIPVSTKKVVGFGLYKDYIARLATALAVADPDGNFRVADSAISS